ncbi:MAG: PorT family protein [Bacteroidia bacterium]|nr:PorT family protein [Bacteroidia bacterium]
MKRILFILTVLLAPATVFSQTLFLEAKGGYKSTWLLNKNVSDDGNEQDYAAGWGNHYGLGASMYFNKTVGLGIDFLMNTHTGAYSGEFDSVDYTSNVRLKTIDIPLMLKLKTEQGGFLEFGVQYSSISSAKYSYDFNMTLPNSTILQSDSSMAVDTSYSSSNLSLVFGLGIQIKFTDRIGLRTGFRFEYGLSDLVGVDGFGRDLSKDHFPYGNNPLFFNNYDSYQKTNTASGSFMLGVYFILGSEKDSTVP